MGCSSIRSYVVGQTESASQWAGREKGAEGTSIDRSRKRRSHANLLPINLREIKKLVLTPVKAVFIQNGLQSVTFQNFGHCPTVLWVVLKGILCVPTTSKFSKKYV